MEEQTERRNSNLGYYKVPYDFSHEEKVFGGYLSIRQMIYVIASIISLGILFIPKIPMLLKIVLVLIIISSFMTFAFLKIGSGYADKSFINIVKYIFRKKLFIFER